MAVTLDITVNGGYKVLTYNFSDNGSMYVLQEDFAGVLRNTLEKIQEDFLPDVVAVFGDRG